MPTSLGMPACVVAALMGTACALMGGDGAVAGSPGAPMSMPSGAPGAGASGIPGASSPSASDSECLAMDLIDGASALLQSLDRSPDRPARVLLKLKPGPQALAEVRRALDAAKATGEAVGGRPLLVAELTASQLRAVLATCQVAGVQRDEPVPGT
ncbi:hypothetical protein [Mitsuaria sp. GD03876]|uniref:hypothetical protein n=1 Tax=Mitsuaria sp. GD03876 TaxID=2975399 RepID=UPI002447B068|nr:hypothetical protein [Mitsuaria sp. GD03876]MDH0862945.1 hypothetical protein [Mitsuaria sp. GD03876]